MHLKTNNKSMTQHIKRSNSLAEEDLSWYKNPRLKNDKNVLRKLKRSYSFTLGKFSILFLRNINEL